MAPLLTLPVAAWLKAPTATHQNDVPHKTSGVYGSLIRGGQCRFLDGL